MYKFSSASLIKLATCHVDLQTLFNEVIKSFDCTVLEGHRNQAGQDAAFARGATKLKWPHGKHNASPSMAVDVAPCPVNFAQTNVNACRFYWFAGFVMGTAERLRSQGVMKHAVRFGGDWDSDKVIDDQTFNDLVHFELV